jgi:hypothetical protein
MKTPLQRHTHFGADQGKAATAIFKFEASSRKSECRKRGVLQNYAECGTEASTLALRRADSTAVQGKAEYRTEAYETIRRRRNAGFNAEMQARSVPL